MRAVEDSQGRKIRVNFKTGRIYGESESGKVVRFRLKQDSAMNNILENHKRLGFAHDHIYSGIDTGHFVRFEASGMVDMDKCMVEIIED